MSFRDVIQTEEELREVYRQPSVGAVRKQQDRLDDNCRQFIARATFVVLATASADGSCDVSPKGGPPGFVTVLDDTRLALPDLSGNNRLDSMRNLLTGSGVALLFCIPGLEETLRVNGRGVITKDEEVLAACAVGDVVPKVAIGVDVDECYIHCAKALRRGAVWQPEQWPDQSGMPTIACMLRDHVKMEGVTSDRIATLLEDEIRTTLWKAGGSA